MAKENQVQNILIHKDGLEIVKNMPKNEDENSQVSQF